MLEQLNASLKAEGSEVRHSKETSDILQKQLSSAWEELKATKRQRVRDLMKHPEREEILKQTYDELEAEAEERIAGLKNQLALTANKRNTIIQVNRIARTALELFDEILAKDKLDRADLELLIEKILVYENRMEITLKADIGQLLRSGTLCREEAAVAAMAATKGDTVNFKIGIVDSATVRADVDIGPYNTQIVQSSPKRRDKVYDVSVISDGDGLHMAFVTEICAYYFVTRRHQHFTIFSQLK